MASGSMTMPIAGDKTRLSVTMTGNLSTRPAVRRVRAGSIASCRIGAPIRIAVVAMKAWAKKVAAASPGTNHLNPE